MKERRNFYLFLRTILNLESITIKTDKGTYLVSPKELEYDRDVMYCENKEQKFQINGKRLIITDKTTYDITLEDIVSIQKIDVKQIISNPGVLSKGLEKTED